MLELVQALTDPELGGATFTVIRETWRLHYGEMELVETVRYEGISGNIQPAASEDIQLFPEEERTEEIIQILSVFEFSLGAQNKEDDTFATSDKIIYQGSTYKLTKTKDWSDAGGFYKAWAVRQKD